MTEETKDKIRDTRIQNKIDGKAQKLNNNLSRTRSKIFEYACCNEWQYFVTVTISKDKYDRYNLDEYRKSFSHWLRNKYNRNGQKIEWLFIPEKHKDGSWHMHGLINGLTGKDLQEFTTDMHIPYRLLNRLKQGVKVYNWTAYADKFGYCTLEPIKNMDAVCKYITKYICKDMATSVQEVGKHLYYCSRGLQTSVVVDSGMINTAKTVLWDFKNDYVFIKSYPKDMYQESYFDDLFNYSQNASFANSYFCTLPRM
jgi:hypothetical protein